MRMKHRMLFLLWLLCSIHAQAQKDTTVNPSVTIISSYKPVLINPAKINFYGSALIVDSIHKVRPYNVPAQNFVYSYVPISLHPLSLIHDTAELYKNTFNFLRLGYGNYKTPLINGGLFFHPLSSLKINMLVDYISSQGNIVNQDYSVLSARTFAKYFLPNDEIHCNLSYSRNQHFLYGYDHLSYSYAKQEVSHLFQDMDLQLGIRNTAVNSLNISYDPTIHLNIFHLTDSLRETTIGCKLPVNFKFNNRIAGGALASVDATKYSGTNSLSENIRIKNAVSAFAGFLKYSNKSVLVQLGASYTQSDTKWSLLPDIRLEIPIHKNNFIFISGWKGTVIKNTYRNLSAINPYLQVLNIQQNSLQNEFFAGFKTTVGNHFTFLTNAEFVRFSNYPLFMNDTSAASKFHLFVLSNESKLNNFRIHADVSYTVRDIFRLTGAVNFNAYSGLHQNQKAWNMVPMDADFSAFWQASPKLELKGSFILFSGFKYLNRGNVVKEAEGGTDLRIAGEYKLYKRMFAFLNLNNIFGKTYERWHLYPVYGINFTGGIKVRF